MSMEKPNIVYGRLSEATHIAGYTFERAMGELKWLLEENRWKEVDGGFDDVQNFVQSISFAEFKIAIEQRKEIAKMLTDIGASQRATAKVLGVSAMTISKDVNKVTPKENNTIEFEDVINEDVNKVTPEILPAKEWFEKNGQKDVKQQIRNEEKQKVKEEKKQEKIEKYIEASKNFDNENIKILLGDFYEYSNHNLKDNSIDAIITDPPYPGEFLYLWEQLFEVANRVLKPSAFLVCYSGQMYLDKIFKMKNDLLYYWTANIIFTQKPLISVRNVINEWKPILIFQKPPFSKLSDTISDTISFDYSERDLHEENWGQTIAPFEFILDKFSKPGDLIFEPFAGTGTTLIACKRTGRKCVGTEIKDEYIDLIKGRLSE